MMMTSATVRTLRGRIFSDGLHTPALTCKVRWMVEPLCMLSAAIPVGAIAV